MPAVTGRKDYRRCRTSVRNRRKIRRASLNALGILKIAAQDRGATRPTPRRTPSDELHRSTRSQGEEFVATVPQPDGVPRVGAYWRRTPAHADAELVWSPRGGRGTRGTARRGD